MIWLLIFSLVSVAGSFAPISAKTVKAASINSQSIIAYKFSSPDPSNVYSEDQVIRINVNYGKIDLKVTADLSVLDETWLKNYPVKNNGTGTYSLVSPIISGKTMNMGSNVAVKFLAEDSEGNFIEVPSSYLVTLKPRVIKGNAQIVAPARFSAKADNEKVTLWWSRISGAEKVLVRYYDDQNNLRQFTVPKTHSGTTIYGLNNGTQYTFEVAGQSIAGTAGKFKTISVTPVGPVKIQVVENELQAQETQSIEQSIGNGVSISKPEVVAVEQEDSQATEQVTQKAEPKAEKIAEEVKSEPEKTEVTQAGTDNKGINKPERSVNWNRLLLAISILLIAAGAAIAGYYGYEWWILRKEKKKVEKPKVVKPSNPNSRW